jgi:hypothetical protein
MTRTRTALSLTTVGLVALLGLTACGVGATPVPPSVSAADATDLAEFGGEALVLTAIGFETGLEAAAAPAAPNGSAAPNAPAAPNGSAAPGTDKARKVGPARKLLRKNTLHGEVTLQTKKGVQTVVVQRGTVTAVNATTVTVKSSDGFTETWTFADKLRVRSERKKADRAAIVVGAEAGVAGAKVGDTATARLIVVR